MRILMILLIMLVATPAFAQTAKFLGTYKAWGLHQYTDSFGNTCTLSSSPTKSAGKYTRRGDVFFHVTIRENRNWQYDISIAIGYPLKLDSEVAVRIDGGKKYVFYINPSQVEHAFLNEKQAQAFIKNMRAGNRMVIKGVSKRGTETTDEFSLSGITAGLNNMKKKCQ